MAVTERVYPAVRFHGKKNERSDDLRLGTWYGPTEGSVARYSQDKVKLGGGQRVAGSIRCSNPYVLESRSQILLTDFCVSSFSPYDPLPPFGGGLIEELYWARKDDAKMNEVAAAIIGDDRMAKKILAQGPFNTMTIATDRVVADWLNTNGYDLLVIQNPNGEIYEMFDFKGLFEPERSQGLALSVVESVEPPRLVVADAAQSCGSIAACRVALDHGMEPARPAGPEIGR